VGGLEEKKNLVIRTELEKSAVQDKKILFLGKYLFSLTCPMGNQGSHLPSKSMKEQIFERYLSQGQAGIQVFFEP